MPFPGLRSGWINESVKWLISPSVMESLSLLPGQWQIFARRPRQLFKARAELNKHLRWKGRHAGSGWCNQRRHIEGSPSPQSVDCNKSSPELLWATQSEAGDNHSLWSETHPSSVSHKLHLLGVSPPDLEMDRYRAGVVLLSHSGVGRYPPSQTKKKRKEKVCHF